MDLLDRCYVRPTGPDETYRRFDFLRGAVVALLGAIAIYVGAMIPQSLFPRSLLAAGVSFGATILAAMSAVLCIVLLGQAVVGSRFPIEALTPEDLAPRSLRPELRQILADEWLIAPQPIEQEVHEAVEHGATLLYREAIRGATAVQLAETLAALEWDEMEEAVHKVFSIDAARRRAAERVHALVAEYEGARVSSAV